MSYFINFILLIGVVFGLSVVVIGVSAAKDNNDEILNIHVYYESLCPDSRRFIINGLDEAYKKFKNITNIILVPFGKANVSVLF